MDGVELVCDRRIQPLFADEHSGVFADRHSIDDGNGLHADKRFEFCVEDGAVDVRTVRVWAIENDERAVVAFDGMDSPGIAGCDEMYV